MLKKEEISLSELKLLVIGFVFGGLAVTSPTKAAYQDAWLAQIISWLLGFLLASIYILIAKLNNKKSLIEILKECFGKYLGSIISIFYIIFFIHLATITIRIFGEYMVSVNYSKSSTVYIICITFLPIAYALKKGILISARVNQLIIPVIIGAVLLTIFASIPEFNFKNLLPMLEEGFNHVFKIGFRTFSLSFGNMIAFLMIYPIVKKQEGIVRHTYIGITIVGLILLGIILRNLLVLGSHIMALQLFPPHVAISLIPWAVLDPLISVNIFAGVGVKVVIFIYCTAKGICQLLNLEDYRLIILPLCTVVISSAMWFYPNYPTLYRWIERNMLYYALPFQIIIPCIVLIISLIRNRKPKENEVC